MSFIGPIVNTAVQVSSNIPWLAQVNPVHASNLLKQKQIHEDIMDGSRHPAAIVYDWAASGQLKAEMSDRSEPCATWEGRAMDAIVDKTYSIYQKTKSYFGETQKKFNRWFTEDATKGIFRGLFEDLEGMDIDFDQASCNYTYPSEIACIPVATGLNFTGRLGNCSYNNPVPYYVHFTSTDLNGEEAEKLRNCINQLFQKCQKNCNSCWGDWYDGQRTGSNNFTFDHTSYYAPNKHFKIYVDANEDIYKSTKISAVIDAGFILTECQKPNYDLNGAQIAIIMGIVTAVFIAIGTTVATCLIPKEATEDAEDKVPLKTDDELEMKNIETPEETVPSTQTQDDVIVDVDNPKNPISSSNPTPGDILIQDADN